MVLQFNDKTNLEITSAKTEGNRTLRIVCYTDDVTSIASMFKSEDKTKRMELSTGEIFAGYTKVLSLTAKISGDQSIVNIVMENAGIRDTLNDVLDVQTSLRNEVAEAKANMDTKAETLQANIDTVTSSIDKTNAAVAKLNQKADTTKSLLDSVSEIANGNKEDITGMETILESLTETVSELETATVDLGKQIEDLQSQINDINTALTEIAGA